MCRQSSKHVIPVKMSVNMQFSGNTDCHTSDVGHWFAMTKNDFVYSLPPLTSWSGAVVFVYVQKAYLLFTESMKRRKAARPSGVRL